MAFLEPVSFKEREEFLAEFERIDREEQVLKLHKMLAPYMLRRMKVDVAKVYNSLAFLPFFHSPFLLAARFSFFHLFRKSLPRPKSSFPSGSLTHRRRSTRQC